MRIRLSQIMSSQDAIKTLASQKLPVRTAYKIQKNLRLLEPEVSNFEKIRSQLIMEKYGEEEEGSNGSYKVPPENMKDYLKELNQLLDLEVTVDIQKVTLPENFEMLVSDVYALDWMIDFDEEEKEENKNG